VCAQVRTQQPAWDGANQKGADEIGIDIAEAEVQQAGDARQNHGMNDVCTYHYFGREAIEQQ